jgi:hypothetical protein
VVVGEAANGDRALFVADGVAFQVRVEGKAVTARSAVNATDTFSDLFAISYFTAMT